MGGDAQSIFLGQTIDRVGEYDAEDPFYGMKESDNLIATKSNTNNPNNHFDCNIRHNA